MKSRFAMTAMLVTGLLMSGTGAGLAVSGLDGTKDASVAQYGDRTVPPAPTPAPTEAGSLPCDRNGDGRVDGNEDANGDAPGCEMDDGSRLPTSTQSDPTCDENGDGVISPSEAAKNGCGGVESETDANVPSSPNAAAAPGSDNSSPAAETDDAPAARENAAQPNRQVAAADGDELPFTGFAAVPILVGGIALLGGGLVLRRRTA